MDPRDLRSAGKSTSVDKGDERALRIGQILNELLDGRAQGEEIDESDIRLRHPELAEEILAHAGMVSTLKRRGDPIAELVARGVLEPASDDRYLARLGPYWLSGLLGSGGMGIVLKAWEAPLNRTVALKLLRPELSYETSALDRFAREAKAAGMLKHANIVTIFAVGEERGARYLVTEYIPGGTLSDLVRRRGPLPSDLARNMFHQILQGLRAAHSAGLVHRDIKSSNILVQHEEENPPDVSPTAPVVKIADFGLARMYAAQTRITAPDSTLGTPEYMSPEQARGEEHVDHRSDLYSAGVVLYEMLTGRTPFRAEKPSAIVHRILHEKPADPRDAVPGIDRKLSSMALRLMAKEPADRFDSADEVLSALESRRRIPSIEARRRTFLRASIGLFVVVVVIALAWLMSTINPGSYIREVREPPGETPSEVWVMRGDSTAWELLHDFGTGVTEVKAAERADLDGDGLHDRVITCVNPPVDGASVIGLGPDGTRISAWDPAPAMELAWPDRGDKPTGWICEDVLIEDIDGLPGDEIIVQARDAHAYPTRITVLVEKGRKLEPVSTFWHMGHLNALSAIRLAPDGRVGILARGVNNKLDGFREPNVAPTFQFRAATYEFVPIVVVLDAAHMDGVGPPGATSLPFPRAKPYGYAYLDLDAREPSSTVSQGETASIENLAECPYLPDHTPDGCLTLNLRANGTPVYPRADLEVDNHLNLLSIRVGPQENVLRSENAWKESWHLIGDAASGDD